MMSGEVHLGILRPGEKAVLCSSLISDPDIAGGRWPIDKPPRRYEVSYHTSDNAVNPPKESHPTVVMMHGVVRGPGICTFSIRYRATVEVGDRYDFLQEGDG